MKKKNLDFIDEIYSLETVSNIVNLGNPKKIYLYIDGKKFYMPDIIEVMIDVKTDILAGRIMASQGLLIIKFKPHPLYCPTGNTISIPLGKIKL